MQSTTADALNCDPPFLLIPRYMSKVNAQNKRFDGGTYMLRLYLFFKRNVYLLFIQRMRRINDDGPERIRTGRQSVYSALYFAHVSGVIILFSPRLVMVKERTLPSGILLVLVGSLVLVQ